MRVVGSPARAAAAAAAATSYQQHLDASALTAQRLETMRAELFAAQRTVGEQVRQSARQAAARLAEAHEERRAAVRQKEAAQAELQQVRAPHPRARTPHRSCRSRSRRTRPLSARTTTVATTGLLFRVARCWPRTRHVTRVVAARTPEHGGLSTHRHSCTGSHAGPCEALAHWSRPIGPGPAGPGRT
jgi:hypothetical protein